MRCLATIAVTLGFVTAAPAATAAGNVQLTADQAQLTARFLAPAPHQSTSLPLYTSLSRMNPGSTGEWSAVRAVPKPAVKKKTTTATKPAVKKKKKPAPKTAVKPTRAQVVRPVTVVAAPSGSRVSTVVNFALAQVGKPYRWGAAGPGAYDCSGLTMAAFSKVGIHLAHQSGAQANAGRAVSRAQLQRGDLILYSGHVAIALGGGKMVHAANPRTGIVVANIYGSPIGYRRLL